VLDDGVSLPRGGEARECVEIARRIQSEPRTAWRSIDGGVPARPARYRAHLEEALRRAAIPAWFARGTTRPIPGRAFLALLVCARKGFRRRFAEYVSLAGTDPSGRRRSVAPPRTISSRRPATNVRPRRTAIRPKPTRGSDPRGTLRAPGGWSASRDAAVIGGATLAPPPRRARRGARRPALELAERRPRAALGRAASDLRHLREFALR